MSSHNPSNDDSSKNSQNKPSATESACSTTSSSPGQESGGSSLSVAETQYHAKRVSDLQERQQLFEQSTSKLATYFANPEIVVVTPVASAEALLIERGILLHKPEDYTNATQSNLARVSAFCLANHQGSQNNSSSQNRNEFYVHLLKLKGLPNDYKKNELPEALKILKYFCQTNSPGRQSCFLRVYDTFLLVQEQQVLVAEEKFYLENTIQHRMWSNTWQGSYKTQVVKMWTIQLAEAIEKLNQAGVAHRFIRPENVVLTSRNDETTSLRLASFDFACLFWDIETCAPKPISRGLPLELQKHLLDHLPPECFFDSYDASNVDIWSLGVLICQLLTGNAPFDTPDLVNDGLSEHEMMWKRSDERRMLPEEIRSLLDDVFKEADGRITIQEICKDFRLTCKNTREFVKKKLPAYYRIDIAKNINVDGPSATVPHKAPLVILSSTFSEHSSVIFRLDGYYKMRKLTETDVIAYRILRDQSFKGDFAPNNIVNDFYLKAIEGQEVHCLAKVFQKRRVPIGHRNLLLNESSKIMRYFSIVEPLNARVHRVLDAYLCEESTHHEKMIVFYESLARHRSLYNLVKEVPENFRFPPPARGNSMLTLANIQIWIRDLTQTVEYLANHGLAHRYIRPEYIFINEANFELTKLTHFDMACFAWNPIRLKWVPRTQGLQDRQDHLWDHLPPECFDRLYNGLQVDVWSIGVVLTFCLTGAKPFSSPMTINQANEQWANFKATHAAVFNRAAFTPLTEILNIIFVATENRLAANSLLGKLSSDSLKMDEMVVTQIVQGEQQEANTASNQNQAQPGQDHFSAGPI